MGKKIAFISGATSGIGAAFARHYAGNGYDLILTGHPDDAINLDTEALKQKCGIKVELISADLSDDSDIRQLEDILRQHDDIEILINNAGFFFGKPFWQIDAQGLERMIKVHINTPVRFILAALPNMTKNHKGVIINMSSLASFMPVPQDAMYSATKLFSNSFMESLHISVKEKGIKVQVLCPGFVRNTNFHARAGMKQSERKNWDILPWIDPENVVEISVRNLRRNNKVIVVPGFGNKVIRFVMTRMPRKVYYSFAAKFLQ